MDTEELGTWGLKNWRLSEQLGSINVLMAVSPQKELYTTTVILAAALQVESGTLDRNYQRNRGEFDGLRLNTSRANGLSTTSSRAKQFMATHKEQFGIKRLRDDMHLWSESDTILHIVLSRTPQGRQMRKEFIEFVKQHAVLTDPTWQQMGELRAEVEELRNMLLSASPSLRIQASGAGTLLNAQKATKQLRQLH